MKKEKYWESDEVQEIAAELIPKHHQHLKRANIAYMFQDKARRRDVYVVLGTARRARDIDKKLHGFDFVMCIAHDTWENLSDLERTKLVDHELCHMWYKVDKVGNIIWLCVDHDIKDFKAIIERYGVTDYVPTELREKVDKKKEK